MTADRDLPDPPAPFADDRLREIATTGWTPTTTRLAAELLDARARIAELKAEQRRPLVGFVVAVEREGEPVALAYEDLFPSFEEAQRAADGDNVRTSRWGWRYSVAEVREIQP